ncbi:MAG: cell division protein FtsQ [Prevotellaceae bacterium]|nr:cell division protein FtsQ [Prevotella sp.]MDD7257460.1 cell division protein FtsQ [Prevotellaceae bacterium]MDY6130905.1 cell division protein FtsQ [Prevotella sp.]
MHINWKKALIVFLDIVLAVYLGFAVTAFNNPDVSAKVCTKVSIHIADENANGFLSAREIKSILEKKKLYPLERRFTEINPRNIEEVLKTSSFVKTAQCYKTQDGHVNISVTQRLPVVRIKNVKGEDYYLDDKGGVMLNSKYTSDLIIATGYINRGFARKYLSPLTETLMESDFWKNQIEQINVLPDQGIELVPRVGDHVVFIGYMPERLKASERVQAVTDCVKKKLDRLEKFYKYGLNQAGWNKYHYISLEFDNQIICKRNEREVLVESGSSAQAEEKKNEVTDENVVSVEQPGKEQVKKNAEPAPKKGEYKTDRKLEGDKLDKKTEKKNEPKQMSSSKKKDAKASAESSKKQKQPSSRKEKHMTGA